MDEGTTERETLGGQTKTVDTLMFKYKTDQAIVDALKVIISHLMFI